MIDRYEINTQALKLRQHLGVDGMSPVDISALARSIKKLTLVFWFFTES